MIRVRSRDESSSPLRSAVAYPALSARYAGLPRDIRSVPSNAALLNRPGVLALAIHDTVVTCVPFAHSTGLIGFG